MEEKIIVDSSLNETKNIDFPSPCRFEKKLNTNIKFSATKSIFSGISGIGTNKIFFKITT